MNRRSAIVGIFALGALAGCQNGTTPQTQLKANAALVTAGVAAVAASVLATPNLAQDTKDKINNALATVVATNNVIQQATVMPTGNAAQQLVVAIKVAAPILLAMLVPTSSDAIALNAALALLPTILTLAGVPPAPAAAMATKKMMDPATASLVLHGYTGK